MQKSMLWCLLLSLSAMATGCAEDCEDTESAVVVTISGDGAPIIASVEWSSEDGESGIVDCVGECEIRPEEEGTVDLVVTPELEEYGDSQADSVGFSKAQDGKCEEPVYSYIDFSFSSSR